VKPAFQPIISAVNHTISGYEVLGRIEKGSEMKSLGEFFHDADVPDDFKAEVDTHLLESAISIMIETGAPGSLFINRNAKQLMVNSGEDLLHTLAEFTKKGFAMERIVLEITEHDFDEDFDALSHLLRYYKTYGIQIAVDHVGAKSSNIDRIRQLQPHILKIDTGITRNNQNGVSEDITYSLALLARRIGAKLAYENIEDKHQLYFAWKHGGHYYQGFYLAKPQTTPVPTDSLVINVRDNILEFVHREKSLVEGRYAFARQCEEKVKKLLPKWQGPEQADAFIATITGPFDEESFRMYICRSDGEQISSNFRKRGENWDLEPLIKGANWSFRPYFLENVMHMKTWHRGMLSDTYSDIETGETVRTFSYPLSDEHFLYIDISYAFIFENDFLFMQ
jgi:EAL domain-containing protein (putative c-di-GMP-specific phosphodiesterase class I)